MRGMPDQFFRGPAIQIGIWGILNLYHIAENYWRLLSRRVMPGRLSWICGLIRNGGREKAYRFLALGPTEYA